MTDTSTGAHKYNAVFKGGGAKGIAYAGALHACEDMGIAFAAVAGSSAGAITATLVASGYTADEIEALMPSALKTMGSVMGSLALLGRHSLLSNRKLRAWLSRSIAEKIQPGFEGHPPDCTFEDVKAATGIDLFVVALDLATRQPVVFSPAFTPTMPVADAVVASSAIPVAFSASRVASAGQVHRFVDGGTWANYPSFIFLDSDFRTYHELGDTEQPTIGFILDEQRSAKHLEPADLRPQRGRLSLGDRGSVADQFGLPGAILSSWVFRLAAFLVPLFFLWIGVVWLARQMADLGSTLGLLHQSLQDPALILVVMVFSLTAVLAAFLSFVSLRIGGAVLDTGLVGAAAAMGVGPNVPYWIGAEDIENPRHAAVRIPVPAALTTLNFAADDQLRTDAIEAGYEATLRSIDRNWREPVADVPPDSLSGEASVDEAEPISNHFILRSIALMYVLAGGMAASFGLLRSFTDGGSGMGQLALFCLSASAAMVGIWILARSRLHRKRHPYYLFGGWSHWRLVPIAAVGLMLAIGFGWLHISESVSTFTTLRAETTTGEVQRFTPDVSGESGFVMDEVQILIHDPPKFASDAELRNESSEPVVACGPDPRCYVFRVRDQKLERGDHVEIRYDPDERLLFLGAGIWTFDRVASGTGALLLALLTGSAATRSIGAMRHKRRVRASSTQAGFATSHR